MQLTSLEMDKEEEKGCINDFLDKMNIFLNKSLKKHILELGWNLSFCTINRFVANNPLF